MNAHRLSAWTLALCCTASTLLGLAFGDAHAQSSEAKSVPRDARATASGAEPVAAELGHGRDPLFGGGMVPLKWMPPGTNASPLPSDRIFPTQTITIRFNHSLHSTQLGKRCRSCHPGAYTSQLSSDRLLPDPVSACDKCHGVDHSKLAQVRASGPKGRCAYCHLGQDPGAGGRVARMVIPRPNLRMSHKKHLDRNIQCPQCHGSIDKLELATRGQLPRMAGCFACHAKSGAAQGKALGRCAHCHLTKPNGQLQTQFAAGRIKPPTWLHGADHGANWTKRHKLVAGANSELCASCHSKADCQGCHDGKLRPRRVHPGDWLSAHPLAARQDNPRCVSCHQLQSFCADCHRRVGVARDAPSANRLAGRRFHPAPNIWTTGPRGPQHHAWEAQRNLNTCVACHSERDCVSCHATKGLRGGQGINPHPLGFASNCSSAFKRNSRPCLVCHSSTDHRLAPCR